MQITRRDVVLGTAAASVAVTVPVPASADDSQLLSLVEDCRRLLAEWVAARDAALEARNRADAHPDDPYFNDGSLSGKEQIEATHAHWEQFGVTPLYDRWNDLGRKKNRAMDRVRDTTPRTHRGLAAKFRMVYEVAREDEGWSEYFIADGLGEWFEVIGHDFERLAEGGVA